MLLKLIILQSIEIPENNQDKDAKTTTAWR